MQSSIFAALFLILSLCFENRIGAIKSVPHSTYCGHRGVDSAGADCFAVCRFMVFVQCVVLDVQVLCE